MSSAAVPPGHGKPPGVAALRGHKVTLFEKSGRLGGRLWLASMIKGSDIEDVKPVIKYLTRQINERSSVTVRLNTEVTPELISREKPDVVVIATGGNYALPDVPGIHRWNVQGVKSMAKLAALPLRVFGPDMLNELTKIVLPLGSKITIIGGQIEGIQGAVFLKKRGKDVTVLEASDHLGDGIPPRYKERALPWLQKKGTAIHTEVTVESVDGEGVHYRDKDGVRHTVKSHSVLVLTRQTPNHDLANALKYMVPEVHVIGSANGAESSLIVNAISEGRALGVKL